MTRALFPSPTSPEALDATVERVKSQAPAFARLSVKKKRALCDAFREGYKRIAERATLAACDAKGIAEGSQLEGEEWLNGAVLVVRALRLMSMCLADVERYGVPRIPRDKLSRLPDGRLRANLFPWDLMENALLPLYTGEVHFQPGITEDNLAQHQASFYRKPHEGRLCAVLGAGNVNSIPPLDCIQKLFAEGTVCVLKMNPVNSYLGPFLEEAFRPAVDAGYLAVVYGGAEQGIQLTQHALVDEVHITGSDVTHDALVWGPPGPDRDARKSARTPLYTRPVSSELGNITPVILVPGPYEDAELLFQASNVAGMVANNASFNCNSAKLVVTPQKWDGRGFFMDALEQSLGKAAPRKAYYPGAAERFHAFTDQRPGVKLMGKPGPGELPYGVLRDVDSKRLDDRVFHQEPWCSLISETALPGREPIEFLEHAVHFLNENVWGTLCAMLVVSPAALQEPGVLQAVESAIRELHYGGVAVNTWPAAIYAVGTLPWGGHPVGRPEDIQSGMGFVHNPFMLEGVEKAVLRAPVKHLTPPVWVPGHKTLRTLGRRLLDFEDSPSLTKLPGLALDAFRG